MSEERPKPFEDWITCASKYCLLFPVDAKFDNDVLIQCYKCKQSLHILCEGLTEQSIAYKNNRESYSCITCCDFSPEEITRKFEKEVSSLENSQRETFENVNNFQSKISEKMHELDLLRGPAEKTLDESFKTLGKVP